MFCPKCHSLLKPKMEKNKKVAACSCGYTSAQVTKAEVKEQVKGAKEIELFEEVETKPLTDADCQKCGHRKAYFWTMQTRAADEAETRFFRCEKCKHTWREYK